MSVSDETQFPFTIIPNAFFGEHMAEVGGSATMVYFALKMFASNSTGKCFPKKKTLALMTGLGEATIESSIKKLVKRKLITVAPGYRNDGGQSSNIYTIKALSSPPTTPQTDPTGHGQKKTPQELDVKELDSSPGELNARASEEIPKPKPEKIDFAVFYDAYPKHEGRAQALKTWDKLSYDEQQNAILVLAGWIKTGKFSPEARFIAAPSSWLNKYALDESPLVTLAAGRRAAQTFENPDVERLRVIRARIEQLKDPTKYSEIDENNARRFSNWHEQEMKAILYQERTVLERLEAQGVAP